MLTSSLAVWILLGLAVVLAIIIPILNSVERFSNFISLRWSCVAIILLIMVGVVIDFEHLADNTRDIVLRGGLIVIALYLVLRTGEKVLYNGWLKGINLKGSIQKGDLKASAEVKQVETKSDKDKTDKPKGTRID